MSDVPMLTAFPGAPALAPAPAPTPLLAFSALGTRLSEESKLELLEYWRSISRRRWPILGLGLAVAVVAIVVAFALRPVYRSTSTVLVEAGKPKIVSIEEVYGAIGGQGREHFQTQVELLKSRDVALRTVTATKLWNDPEFDPRRKGKSITSRIKQVLSMEREQDAHWSDEKVLAEATIGAFKHCSSLTSI